MILIHGTVSATEEKIFRFFSYLTIIPVLPPTRPLVMAYFRINIRAPGADTTNNKNASQPAGDTAERCHEVGPAAAANSSASCPWFLFSDKPIDNTE